MAHEHGARHAVQKVPWYRNATFRMDALYCPSGIALYSGELFPQWQGDILIGALVNNEVRRVRLSNHGREASDVEGLFGELDERIRDVRVRPRR